MTKIFVGVMVVNQDTGLTLEQKFKLHVFKQEVQTFTKEQTQEYLLEAFKQMMLKDKWIARILKDCA